MRRLEEVDEAVVNGVHHRFGSRLVVVISSASAAEDCFSQNDVALANRPRLLSGVIVAYNFSTLVTSPYGSRWRSLRKTSPAHLSSISKVWSDAVENLIRKIVQRKSKSKVVVLRPMVREMIFEILMTILAGERGELEAVMETIKDVLEHTGTANPADFVALLKWIDFTGYRKSLKRIFSEVAGLLQEILDDVCVTERMKMISVLNELMSYRRSVYKGSLANNLLTP